MEGTVETRRTERRDRTRGDFTMAFELPAGTPLEMTEKTASDLIDKAADMLKGK